MERGSLVIRPLSPELREDWLRFFDQTAFEDHKDWAFCYCLEGHLTPETQEKWTNAQERREKAIEWINSGTMRGYLAYSGDTVVGWCNVNDRENYPYLTTMFQTIGYQPGDAAGIRVKVIYCFLIAPHHRRKGVAQSLLDRICEDAVRDGYDYAEVYPFADQTLEFQYHGMVNMYEQNGFAEAADLTYVKVMRKRLR